MLKICFNISNEPSAFQSEWHAKGKSWPFGREPGRLLGSCWLIWGITVQTSYVLVHNCTIFLCSLDVGSIDDQCRAPSIKEKDHLVGWLTSYICGGSVASKLSVHEPQFFWRELGVSGTFSVSLSLSLSFSLSLYLYLSLYLCFLMIFD